MKLKTDVRISGPWTQHHELWSPFFPLKKLISSKLFLQTEIRNWKRLRCGIKAPVRRRHCSISRTGQLSSEKLIKLVKTKIFSVFSNHCSPFVTTDIVYHLHLVTVETEIWGTLLITKLNWTWCFCASPLAGRAFLLPRSSFIRRQFTDALLMLDMFVVFTLLRPVKVKQKVDPAAGTTWVWTTAFTWVPIFQ